MGIKDNIKKFKNSLNENYFLYINNEETTKHSLIIPFIKSLGYDVSNPLLFSCEYPIYSNGKKSNADYVILDINKNPTIIIECKSLKEKIKPLYIEQASRYFNNIPSSKLMIITNGFEYHFFSDINTKGIMDNTPFFVISIDSIDDDDFVVLRNISQEMLDIENFIYDAISYKKDKLYRRVIELLKHPPEELLKILTDNKIYHPSIINDVINNVLSSVIT